MIFDSKSNVIHTKNVANMRDVRDKLEYLVIPTQ